MEKSVLQHLPLELHCFDVEAQRGADSGDVLAIQAFDYGRFASVVEPPAGSNTQKLK